MEDGKKRCRKGKTRNEWNIGNSTRGRAENIEKRKRGKEGRGGEEERKKAIRRELNF